VGSQDLPLSHAQHGYTVKMALYTSWRHARGSRGTPPLTRNLGTGYRWTFNFTLRSLYSPGNNRPVHMEREDGWAPEPVWRFWRRKITCLCRN